MQKERPMAISPDQIERLGKFERLQLAEDLWDRFATESASETDPAVLDELERRARWRDAHPSQGKSLTHIAARLGVRL
jgi:putative addiction module component (TIGR02574 family)